jgi:Asp-tRNA(Asn)/Glu-tRNA(Gln) amidotransferase A subunit family amidase
VADDALVTLTATEAAAELASGAISAEEYSRACLARIDAVDGDIKAFAHLDRDHVLAQARALDERRAERRSIGPLHGVPVAIKDIIDTADYPTELGSPLGAGRRPRSAAYSRSSQAMASSRARACCSCHARSIMSVPSRARSPTLP